ncbi:MAG: hypothetical protein ACRC28_11820 [Clostridium sp.]
MKKLESKNDKESIGKVAEDAKKLAKDLAESSSRLLKNEEIYGEDFHRMLLGIQNLIEYLNRVYFKNDEIEKEVGNMTKTLYDSEVEKRGEIRGVDKGIELAKKIFKLSRNGKSIDEIAKECNTTLEKVSKILE